MIFLDHPRLKADADQTLGTLRVKVKNGHELSWLRRGQVLLRATQIYRIQLIQEKEVEGVRLHDSN